MLFHYDVHLTGDPDLVTVVERKNPAIELKKGTNDET